MLRCLEVHRIVRKYQFQHSSLGELGGFVELEPPALDHGLQRLHDHDATTCLLLDVVQHRLGQPRELLRLVGKFFPEFGLAMLVAALRENEDDDE